MINNAAMNIVENITEEYKMAERHLRKCSTSLVVRAMQNKQTKPPRFHLTDSILTDSTCKNGQDQKH